MEQWDMSENFLRKEIRTGKLKCVHFGSRVKFTQSQIDEYYNKYVLDNTIL